MDLFGQSFSAVLFDMDGTLISSTAAVQRSWERLAKEYDASMELLGEFHGVPAKQLITRLLPEKSAAEQAEALERVITYETADLAGIEILPGAIRALETLNSAHKSAIVTSCSAGLANARLGAADLPVPSVLVTADDVKVGKPDPAPYILGAQRLGVAPSQCLVVEDAPAGCESGRAAGMKVLAVEVTHPPTDLVADVFVRDLGSVRFDVSDAGVSVLKD